jgi:hypothetical protein
MTRTPPPTLLLLCGLVTLSAPLAAAPILPAGAYPELDAMMARHGRQFYHINALPFGLSLDAHAKDEASRAAIEQFLAQADSDDVTAVTGQHPFELLKSYGEYGDLGFFGGVAVAGTAYEYLTLKAEGAPAAALAVARARVERAARSWHIFKVVTGGGGLVARGIRRRVPEDPADPPIPDVEIELTPLFDEDGQPLPQPKNNGTYRADNSGGALADGVWSWKDSCSKDQLVGQVFAMCTLYDALKDDPDADQGLVAELAEDARLIGEMLMTRREISDLEGPVGAGEYDLIIFDADGRPTYHHDLNPLSLEKLYLPEGHERFNVFNLIMAIGVIKGLHHVSGDPALEAFLYEEMLGARGYLDKLAASDGLDAMDYIYMGMETNTDNPDMSAVALWLALYHEEDPEVTEALRWFLETRWWDREGEFQTARLSKQPLWHAVYLALSAEGTDPALVEEVADLLSGFDLGPYWNPQRVNCDADEIAAGECLAIDGETVLTLAGTTMDGDLLATEALHPRIRPPSNFNARSNPFRVNGGGGDRLNPGGDLLASYWILRYLQSREPGEVNVSPHTRDHMPVVGPVVDPEGEEVEATPDAPEEATTPEVVEEIVPDAPDTAPPAPDTTAEPQEEDDASGGGGCNMNPTPSWPTALLLLLLTLLLPSTRRHLSP